jgi:hypothetical protein
LVWIRIQQNSWIRIERIRIENTGLYAHYFFCIRGGKAAGANSWEERQRGLRKTPGHPLRLLQRPIPFVYSSNLTANAFNHTPFFFAKSAVVTKKDICTEWHGIEMFWISIGEHLAEIIYQFICWKLLCFTGPLWL